MAKSAFSDIKSIAVIGNYAPRQCGIATFTTDLVESLSRAVGENACWALAMNDQPEGYDYPGKVRFEINQHQLKDYRLAADYLNISHINQGEHSDVVCVQHEYGIFGGPAGSYILELLGKLRMPVVTTLHTVLPDPDPKQRAVLRQLADLSDRLVVMAHKAVDILQTHYDIGPDKVAYIPHGIPDMPFVDPNYYKEQFGLLDKKVALTFGLLSKNKGIEYALKAMARAVKSCPDLVYVVLGATHPHVLKAEGEDYRISLGQLVRKLKLEKHVIFQNRFVTLDELCEYLAAADVYITPYVEENQITSGTLAYAMGTGKPVISTPYWYAQEMLDEGRGRLVPFKDSDAMGEALVDLLSDDAERHRVRKRAYDFSRSHVWSQVAQRYLQLFREVKAERSRCPRPYQSSPSLSGRLGLSQELPELRLDHLAAMTDDTGMLQHARYNIPDRDHGYCTDDNARALMVAAQACSLAPEQSDLPRQLADRYLAFLLHAFNPDAGGRFRNFMSYDRRWLETRGSDDSHGRALWGLGTTIALLGAGQSLPVATSLFKAALPVVEEFPYVRAQTFALLGLCGYLSVFSGDSEARRIATELAEKLYRAFTKADDREWPWPEDVLTYDNARLPQALIVAGEWLGRRDMVESGVNSLSWLVDGQLEGPLGEQHFVPVGNNGWYPRGGHKARFDQQPLEANAMLDACLAAYRATGEELWLERAMIAFNWFLGQNDLSLSLYDAKTNGCCDGLQSDCVNLNQGAESTLAWLLSVGALQLLSEQQVLQPRGGEVSVEVRSEEV